MPYDSFSKESLKTVMKFSKKLHLVKCSNKLLKEKWFAVKKWVELGFNTNKYHFFAKKKFLSHCFWSKFINLLIIQTWLAVGCQQYTGKVLSIHHEVARSFIKHVCQPQSLLLLMPVIPQQMTAGVMRISRCLISSNTIWMAMLVLYTISFDVFQVYHFYDFNRGTCCLKKCAAYFKHKR